MSYLNEAKKEHCNFELMDTDRNEKDILKGSKVHFFDQSSISMSEDYTKVIESYKAEKMRKLMGDG